MRCSWAFGAKQRPVGKYQARVVSPLLANQGVYFSFALDRRGRNSNAVQVQALTLGKRQSIQDQSDEIAGPSPIGGTFFQFMVGVYGGFFGAGMGILTLAALAMIGYEDIQELNALKNLTSGVNYLIAASTFIIAGAISWPHTMVMLAAGIVGGYVGGRLARKLPAVWLRRVVIATGSILSLVFFIKVYF